LTNLYSNLWDSLGKFIQSWLLPSIIALGFFTVALLPAVREEVPWSGIYQLSSTERGLLFAFLTIVLSFLLASSAREFTRFLEGYVLWPSRLKNRGVDKQKAKREELFDKIEASSSLPEKLRHRARLNQYPRDPDLILPTRLGNALRAGESYGWIQYGLSVVDLWTRLTAVAEDKINEQLSQSRAVLNFFIAMIWLSAVLSIATVVVSIWGGHPLYLLWLIPLALLVPVWYRRAVAAVSWYAQGMQALADLTRGRLAEALGLSLPGTIEDERKLWTAFNDYASWGPGWSNTSDWVKTIDDATVPRGARDEASKSSAHQERGGPNRKVSLRDWIQAQLP
jgi:ABC-type multidrug transport system fused ATPase/permease subunit